MKLMAVSNSKTNVIHAFYCHHAGPNGTCGESEFGCRNGFCILYDFICDGRSHCADGSDEDQLMCGELAQLRRLEHNNIAETHLWMKAVQ